MTTSLTILLVALLGLTVGIICGVVLSALLLGLNVANWIHKAVQAANEGHTVAIGEDNEVTIEGDIKVKARTK